MRFSRIHTLVLLLIALLLSACNRHTPKRSQQPTRFTVATVQQKDVVISQPYLGRINAHHHIDVRATDSGLLAAVNVEPGQAVKQGDVLFQLNSPGPAPSNTKDGSHLVAIKAPFDGKVERIAHAPGGYVEKGETLTTLDDNDHLWVYFNVPEARFLAFKSADLDHLNSQLKIELTLRNGEKFDQMGKLGAIGANFDPQTGNIPFRADFPNPGHKLSHGATGTVLLSEVRSGALVVPQKATIEELNKRYVYVVDKDDVAHRHEIVVQNETDDVFVVKSGVAVDDKIVVDGVHLLQDGAKVQYEHQHTNNVAAK